MGNCSGICQANDEAMIDKKLAEKNVLNNKDLN